MRTTSRDEVSFYYALQEERSRGCHFDYEQPQGLGLREFFRDFSFAKAAAIVIGVALFFALGWIAGL